MSLNALRKEHGSRSGQVSSGFFRNCRSGDGVAKLRNRRMVCTI